MNRLLTAVVGTVAESWQELRVDKGRVMLSLVGVTIAVASLSLVVGFGSLAERATARLTEQLGGRPATFALSALPGDGEVIRDGDEDGLVAEYRRAGGRYDVRWASDVVQTSFPVQFPDGVDSVDTELVDAPYGEIHRVSIADGRWFDRSDATRLAVPIVVNQPFLDRLGASGVAAHPTVLIDDGEPHTAIVVGVVSASGFDGAPSMYVLRQETPLVHDPEAATRSYEMWLPERDGAAIARRVAHDAERVAGDHLEIQVFRADKNSDLEDPLAPLRAVIAGVSVLVLVLGAIGLLNVSLVSVRQRVRQIGIRRGVGASAGRVFVAVLFENVLGTLVAGAVGVMIGAGILANETVRSAITFGVDVGGVSFPIDAALVGIGSSVLVGLLAGVVPALVAVRVKVIDAIRY